MSLDTETPRVAVGDELAVNETVRVEGTYIAHWEWSRLVVVKRRRRWWRGETRCQLEPREGIAADVFDAAGVSGPPIRRRAGAARFTVVVDVTPLERGWFGHMGLNEWRLRVEDWIAVTPAPRQRSRHRLGRSVAVGAGILAGITAAAGSCLTGTPSWLYAGWASDSVWFRGFWLVCLAAYLALVGVVALGLYRSARSHLRQRQVSAPREQGELGSHRERPVTTCPVAGAPPQDDQPGSDEP